MSRFSLHVNKIPPMQFFTGISRNTQSKSYMLSLAECVLDFQNNAYRDNDDHALLFTFKAKVMHVECKNRLGL